jgi:hypothetical protein
LNAALKVWRDLLEQGFGPSVLDIGGGFQIPTRYVFSVGTGLLTPSRRRNIRLKIC